jgi:VIT1/CCC1 family predicted Fe2+/Mn2+ transporter
MSLKHHLAEKHNVSPLSTYLREIVYGGTDGIITTFAVVAGFTGADAKVSGGLPVFTVLLFGFANLLADGVSMALGSFLATRSEQDVYKNEKEKEWLEIQKNPEGEKEESIEILMQKGFTKEQARTLTDIYATNPSYWLEFMMKDELALPSPEKEKPHIISLVTFFAFVVCGLLPLVPYMLYRDSSYVFLLSILTTGGALLLLGVFRYQVTKQSLIRSITESLLLGGIAATVAYGVGRMVSE